MEITDIIKVKVFAGYLGQQVVIPNKYQFDGYRTDAESGELTGIKDEYIRINNISGCYPYIHFKLKLKPLSEITDEDYTEMWRLGIEKVGKWNDKEKISAGREIRNILFNGKRDMYPVYNKCYIIQFLQHKGYDLPNYLLDGKTLEQVGLATYEKK